MSVNSHRHVQFPRGQHSKTSFHSGGSAAKETSYVAKVEKVSPESGGFAAGALSYYYYDEMESDREDLLYYQVRHEKYQTDPSQLRYPQNSLYETEYSSERRLLDHHHPRTEYFMEEYLPDCKSRKSSVYSSNRSLHRSYSKMDSYRNSSPVKGAHTVNKRSSQRSSNKINLPERELDHLRSYNRYQEKRDTTSSHSTRYSTSKEHRYHCSNDHSTGTALYHKSPARHSTGNSRKHRSPDHQRSYDKRSQEWRTPSPSYRRLHDSHRKSSSSKHHRTGDDQCRTRYHQSHRSSRRRHCSPESSSCSSSDDDSSSNSSSDSECSDDSFYKSTNCNSSPERRCLKQISRHHRKRKPSPDKHFHQDFYSKSHGQKEQSPDRQYHRHNRRRSQHFQKRLPLSDETIYTDEQRFNQHKVPRNQDLGINATTKTVKVERDPSISDIIEQHLIFHQRCDNIEHMLGQLLERSQKHPLIRHDDSQSLNWKGLCL